MFFATYCNSTVLLVEHCVIANGPVYGGSYFYAVWLVRITLFPTL